MKRWDIAGMQQTARRLFDKIRKRKKAAGHNNDVHFLAREIDDWLPKGIASLCEGTYTPRHLKRLYFDDETVDHLYLPDRILQHVILRQLKPALSHIVSPNCFHIHGPSGVRLATQHLRKALEETDVRYVIRADIRAFYSSIPHHKLVADIRNTFDDPKVQAMLEEIIRNPIDTPRGTQNPGKGIALRGPLSQLFSAIYLKPLDDAFTENTGMTYLRYQDDLIILCRTKRQMNRCRRKLMTILQERHLRLSRKKSRMGSCVFTLESA